MAVNYRGKKFYNIGPWIQTLEPDILADCSTNSTTKGLIQVIKYTGTEWK